MSYDDNHRGVDRRRGSGSQTQNQDTGMASDFCLMIAVLLISVIKKIVAYKLLKIVSHWLTTNKLCRLIILFYFIPMGGWPLH